MIERSARPRLASKARLRLDKKTGQSVLLYPEKGLVLNRTGAAIVALCTGEHSVGEIVDKLGAEFQDGEGRLEEHVRSFLDSLAERGLLEGLAP